MSVEILQTHKLLDSCQAALAKNFTVHKLFEAEDREALLASVAPRIRGIAAGGRIDAKLMDALPKLEIIASFGVGYDSIDIEAARTRGIHVTNTPDVLNDAVAELGIGLMLSLSRRIPQADAFVRAGRWAGRERFPFSFELTGRTLGILGLGRIGKEVASRAQGLKMRVVYHGRHKQKKVPYVYYDKLEDMARDSDWLLVVTPGGKGTEGIVSRAVLEALGPDGALVNIARGSVVDQAALVDLLRTGKLGGAALDVFVDEPNVPEELFTLDNVVLSPHVASATQQTRDAMGALVVENLIAQFKGEPLLSPVV
ncbi:2-hydroxyacid dehydrogenase [Paradevosia shaoguanensis]|uniref:2-hydroxyacid dehydrogenase n=1 Tax=Paradevosia shaoguanensis TaxID=1335043 RepID=UPI003C7650A3